MNGQNAVKMPDRNGESPWLAVLLSMVFPGAGHIYCGETSRGVFFVAITILLSLVSVFAVSGFLLVEDSFKARIFIMIGLVTFLITIVISIYVLFDAYKITRRNNPDVVAQTTAGYRKAWLAAFLSSLIPGIGQFYNKQIIKGIAFIVAVVAIAVAKVIHSLFIIVGLFVYIFAIKDAFDSAEVSNGSNERFFLQNRTVVMFMIAMFTLQSIPFSKIIKETVVEAFKIPSGAMIPTLVIGDHFLLGKLKMLVGPLRRGDIIVFPYPENPTKNFVKRIIGLGGDKIQYINGELYINDQLVQSRLIDENLGEDSNNNGKFGSAIEFEEQIAGDKKYRVQHIRDKSASNGGPWIVPDDSVFVMGDNRDNSQDSRVWGAVKLDGIKGKAMKVYWSWDGAASKVRWDRIGQKIY